MSKFWARNAGQLVECSPTMHKALSTVAHACNPSPVEVEAGGSGTQGQPLLHKEVEVSLGYSKRMIALVSTLILLNRTLIPTTLRKDNLKKIKEKKG